MPLRSFLMAAGSCLPYPVNSSSLWHTAFILSHGSWYMYMYATPLLFFRMAASMSCHFYPFDWQLVCHASHILFLCGSCYMMYVIPLKTFFPHGSWYVILLISLGMSAGMPYCLNSYTWQLLFITVTLIVTCTWQLVCLTVYMFLPHCSRYVIPLISFFWMTAAMS